MSFRRTVRYNSFQSWKRELLDDLGDPIDLTDCTVKLIVKPFLSNDDGVLPDSRAWVDFAASVISATAGTLEFALTPAQTSMPPGTYPAEIRRWRAPDPPAAAPVDDLAGAGAGNVDNGSHTYAFCYVSPYGESDLSPISAGVTVADKTVNGQVDVSGIAVGPDGTTARKLFRTVAGSGGSHKLVATLSDNVTTTYRDNIADASLGAAHAVVISTTPPPEDAEPGEIVVEDAVDAP
jgi:hypothetical protein